MSVPMPTKTSAPVQVLHEAVMQPMPANPAEAAVQYSEKDGIPGIGIWIPFRKVAETGKGKPYFAKGKRDFTIPNGKKVLMDLSVWADSADFFQS